MYQILPMNLKFMMLMQTLSLMFFLTLMFFEQSSKSTFKSSLKKIGKKDLKKNMFLSLFISFDPKTSTFLLNEMNWMSMMIPLFLIFLPFYKKSTRLMIFYKKMNKEIASQLEISLKTKKDGSKMIFLCLFMLIVLCNLIGLIPNFFTPTSHLTMNLFMSLPLWSGVLIFGWYTYTNKMLAHLVPLGTPNMLISFMVMIEIISTLIRPLTLSIRLMANMVSGHLLMTLMGNSMVPCSVLIILIIVIVQTMLFLLESGVALIQAYVFCMLMSLYSDESEY